MPTSFSDSILAARASLIAARALIRQEIQDYPTPIAGCDIQFNHLLAERSRVARALSGLETPVFIPTPRSPTPASGIDFR